MFEALKEAGVRHFAKTRLPSEGDVEAVLDFCKLVHKGGGGIIEPVDFARFACFELLDEIKRRIDEEREGLL